jgi:hypothetical protein
MANEEYLTVVVTDQAGSRGLEDQIVTNLVAQPTDVLGHRHGSTLREEELPRGSERNLDWASLPG